MRVRASGKSALLGNEAASSEAEALQGPASGGERAAQEAWRGQKHDSQHSATTRSPPQPPLLLFFCCCCCFLEKNGLQKRTSTPTQIGLNATEHGNLHTRQPEYKRRSSEGPCEPPQFFSHEGESGSTPPRAVNTLLCPTLSQLPTLHVVLPHLLPSLPVSSAPTSLPAAFPGPLCSRSVYLPVISLTNQPTGAQRNSVTSVSTRKMTSPLFLSQRLKLWTKLFAGKEERKVRGEDRPHRDR